MKLTLVSSLFNYPSTGGGIADTVGVGRALERSGIEISHVYARHPAWPTGGVLGGAPFPSIPVDFTDRAALARGIRRAVDKISPDAVLVTDSWSSKALLAAALQPAYPTFLRFHAYELICPANNLRMLPSPKGLQDCPNNALVTPAVCAQCVRDGLLRAGGNSLHARDARLAQASEPVFHEEIHRALHLAYGIFVQNALAVQWLGEYGQKAIIAGSGVDPEPLLKANPVESQSRPVVFMAGFIEDAIKGYDVLLAACQILWTEGNEFDLWATGQRQMQVAGGRVRLTGWLGPEELAAHYAAATICVVPSVVHESFGIVAAEAMAAGKPVVASRAGGLQEIVLHGKTGLLFERGAAAGLATALRTLLDNPDLARTMGLAGRKRCLERYTWDAVVQRAYLPAFINLRRGE